MALIKLLSEPPFLHIEYPIDNNISVDFNSVKKIIHEANSNFIALVESRGNSTVLDYLKTEDPGNPGKPYSNVYDLWLWLITIVKNPITETVTFDGVNVTHLAKLVTFLT